MYCSNCRLKKKSEFLRAKGNDQMQLRITVKRNPNLKRKTVMKMKFLTTKMMTMMILMKIPVMMILTIMMKVHLSKKKWNLKIQVTMEGTFRLTNMCCRLYRLQMYAILESMKMFKVILRSVLNVGTLCVHVVQCTLCVYIIISKYVSLCT